MSNIDSNKINFIQTLRSLAFFFVLLFHLDIKFFSGGYLGVNLFFILSGFIITKISFDIKNPNSIKEIFIFLKKRVYKLFPFLFITIILVNIAGFFILGQNLYSKLHLQSVSSIFFVSNIYYYFEAGYFDFYSKQNPLLHIWSLAVELQFYCIFIFFIYFFSSYYKKLRFYLILTIIFFSLIFIFKNSINLIFYFSLFRFYEFLLGSIVFLIYNKFSLRKFNNLSCISGLALIVTTIILSDPNSQFKIYIPFLLFAGFLLIAIRGKTVLDKYIFNSPVINYFGNESYLFYLIHWPVIIFYKIFTNNSNFNLIDLVIIVILILFFKLMFEFLYSFFSTKKKISYKNFLIVLAILIIIFPNNFKGSAAKIDNDYYENFESNDVYGKKILLIGDSHAQHLYYGIKKNNKNIKLIQNNFLIDDNFQLNIKDKIDEFTPDIIIFSLRWDHNKKINKIKFEWNAEFDNDVFNYYKNELISVSKILTENTNLIIFGSLPMIGYASSSFDCLSRRLKFKKNICEYSQINENKAILQRYKFNNFMQKNLKDSNIKFINPFNFLCKNSKCKNIIDKKHIYIDDSHLTQNGSLIIANELILKDQYFKKN